MVACVHLAQDRRSWRALVITVMKVACVHLAQDRRSWRALVITVMKVACVHLAQDRHSWRALVITVMNLRVLLVQNEGNFLPEIFILSPGPTQHPIQ